MFELRLCQTREHSPRLLEHHLHTLNKEKQSLIIHQKRWLTSTDWSSFLPGSRSLKSQKPNLKSHYFIKQKKGPLLPIKRYSQFEDRVNKERLYPIHELLQNLQDGHIEISYQKIKNPKKLIHFLKERQPDLSKTFIRKLAQIPLIRQLLPHASTRHDETLSTQHERESVLPATLDKLARPLFKVQIQLSHPIPSYFQGFSLPYLNELQLTKQKSSCLLSAEELASLLAFPDPKEAHKFLNTESTAYLKATRENPLQLSAQDRQRHLHILGKTGMGKSTTLLNLIQQDAEQNHALILLDPHGELIIDALKIIPQHRHKDLILINPAIQDFPLALNPLQNQGHPARQAANLIHLFKALANGSWGPRLEYILRNALLTLIEIPNTTLLDLPRLLTNPKAYALPTQNLELQRFWQQEFLALDPKSRHEQIQSILNKVGPLLTQPLLKNILAQPKSKFDFHTAIQNRSIVLINLAKRQLGEDASRFLGLICTSLIQLALLNNQNKTHSSLIIDEAHNLATPTLAEMLAESRKYGLALTLANQYLRQFPEEIQNSILGNVGSSILFRTGQQDAETLAPILQLEPEDLTQLPPFQAYAQLLHQNQLEATCRLDIQKPTAQATPNLQKLKSKSLQFTRPKALVEEKTRTRYTRPMKKKLLALLFALSLTFSLATPTLAEDDGSDIEFGTDTSEPEEARESDLHNFNVFEILSTEDVDQERFINAAEERGTSPLGFVILRAINILSLLIGTFAFIVLIIAGLMLVTAAGEESRIDRAKAIIAQSLTGVVIAFLAYFIVVLIQSFFY